MGLSSEDEPSQIQGSWTRMRAEERAEQWAQVVQDSARDAKVAELIAKTTRNQSER